MGAAGAHLDQRAVTGGGGHPGSGRGDRGVVVEDGEDHRLQQDALGEGALDAHDRRAREVHLALRVAPDVAAEAVVGEPPQRLLVDDVPLAQEAEHGGVETEVLHRVQDAAGAGHHAVPAPVRQPPGEDLEHAAPFGRTGLQGGAQHRQLVLVREERCRGNVHRQPKVRCVHGEESYSLFVGVTIYGGRGSMGCVTSPAPVEIERTESAEEVFAVPEPDVPWVTIVHNDPVNLMSYVTYVFQTYFGYSKDKATKLMLDVHHKGRAVVSSGSREEMERDVQAMHGYGLWATLQQDRK